MAITLDTTSVNSNFGTSTTFSFTCAGNYLIVTVGTFDGQGADAVVNSVSFNGTGMTAQINRLDTSNASFTASIWTYLNPPQTTANVVVSTGSGGTTEIYTSVVSLNGVDQTNPIDALASDFPGFGLNPSVALTTTADNCWRVDVSGNDRNFANLTGGGAGQTLVMNTATNMSSYKGPITPAGSNTSSFTLSTSGRGNIASIALKPAATGIVGKSYIKRQAVNRASTY